jgi:FtsZ-interacting cell division protein YlmF
VYFCWLRDNHTNDVYHFLNPNAKKIVLSRNVSWLGKYYGTYMKENKDKTIFIDESIPIDPTAKPPSEPTNAVDAEETKNENENLVNEHDVETPNEETDDDKVERRRINWELRNLEMWSAPEIFTHHTRSQARSEDEVAEMAFISAIVSDANEPKNYCEAMSSKQRYEWSNAIVTELKNMRKHNV